LNFIAILNDREKNFKENDWNLVPGYWLLAMTGTFKEAFINEHPATSNEF